jgi:hypothetical protein
MGQSYSSPYTSSARVLSLIQSDQWYQEPCEDTVVLTQDVYTNPFQHRYILQLYPLVPPDCLICVIFPDHPVEKRRVLYCSRYSGDYLSSLSKEINLRIQESRRESLSIIVTFKDALFKFKGITGNIYLIWAERLNLQTIGRVPNHKEEFCPVLIETNAQQAYRNIYIFSQRQLVDLKDIDVKEPIGDTLFCCDSDPRKEVYKVIPTLSKERTDQIVNDIVVKRLVELKQEDVPFSSESSTDVDELTLTLSTSRMMGFKIEKPMEPDEV